MLALIKKAVQTLFFSTGLLLKKKSSREKVIYLTFDDGPHLGITDRLLDLLQRQGCHASFFVIGHYAEKAPLMLKRIIDEGHTLANHSFSHPNFDKIPLVAQQQEIIRANHIIEQHTGLNCRWFRAPQGRWNLPLIWYLFKQKIKAAHWNRDSLDYRKEPVETIIERFYQQSVQAGDIILFHDDNDLCIDVLEVLLPYWQEQGYQFKAL